MIKGLDAGLPAFSPFPTMYSGVVSVKKDFQWGGGGVILDLILKSKFRLHVFLELDLYGLRFKGN